MSKMNGHDPEKHKDNIVHFSDQRKPPVQKSEPVINLPPVTKALCLVLLIIGAAQNFLPDEMNAKLILNFGFIPAEILSAPYAIFTHMFLHAGWLHLAMNVLMLAAFGAGLEKMLDARRMLLIFIGSGIAGAFTHFAFYHDSLQPMIGVSGAVSGLFGALALIMTRGGMLQGSNNALIPFIIIWVGTSLFFGFFGMPGAEGSIAWATHIGGFLAGILFCRYLVVR